MTAPTPDPLDPRRTALLLMDFQHRALATFPAADANSLVNRAAGALSQARATGVKIVYVRVAFTDQDYAAIPARNKTFITIAERRYLAEGSPEAAIHADLTPQPGDVVATKTRVGAFSTTNLANILNPRHIDNLVLAGLHTSGVVLSTLREAADRDYRMLVLADCCADPHPEVHRILLDHVFPPQADVIDTGTFAGLLK
jgi:nicotinamidase-related amidase